MDKNIKYNDMSLTIIIIGKNTSKTLSNCIKSINTAVVNSKYINSYEVIYIDSMSYDDSVDIAKSFNNVETIKIIDGYTSASFGRYLGKMYSKYKNLLFMDSDMYMDKDWFNASIEYYNQYGAIIGERYEKLYKNDAVVKEIPRFYNIKDVEIASNIGGFLMIKKEIIGNINYTPIIKNEEEKDFYAKFYDKNKIYKVPVLAYVHNNYNLSGSRIREYFMPYAKNGYILSFISSIKNNYFKNYISLQKKYIISIIVSILFYVLILNANILGLFSFLLLMLNGYKQIKGSIMTTIFFPYKLIMSLVVVTSVFEATYIYKNNEYKMDIKI